MATINHELVVQMKRANVLLNGTEWIDALNNIASRFETFEQYKIIAETTEGTALWSEVEKIQMIAFSENPDGLLPLANISAIFINRAFNKKMLVVGTNYQTLAEVIFHTLRLTANKYKSDDRENEVPAMIAGIAIQN